MYKYNQTIELKPGVALPEYLEFFRAVLSKPCLLKNVSVDLKSYEVLGTANYASVRLTITKAQLDTLFI